MSGAGNNVLSGGQGSDAVILTDGGNDNVRIDAVRNQTTVWQDTVTAFQVASDVLGLTAGSINVLDNGAAATAAITFSNGNGADLAATAVSGLTVTSAAANATVDAAAATSGVIKFTSTSATSFISAIVQVRSRSRTLRITLTWR